MNPLRERNFKRTTDIAKIKIEFLNKGIEPALPGSKDNNRDKSGCKEDIKYYFKNDIPGIICRRLIRLFCHILSVFFIQHKLDFRTY